MTRSITTTGEHLVEDVKKLFPGMTLLCHWFGNAVYEETATRETLIKLVKHLSDTVEEERKLHRSDIEFLSPLLRR